VEIAGIASARRREADRHCNLASKDLRQREQLPKSREQFLVSVLSGMRPAAVQRARRMSAAAHFVLLIGW
jgi:hypothetical protein